jgi:formylglycine-generating enzyme required for sulfatase activity
MAGAACSEAPKPSEQGKTSREVGVAGKTEGPPKELAVDLGGGVKMEMVLIPAGSFMMGDDNGDDAEKPVHKVTITKPFYLGKYEVTQEQWEAVMGNNPSKFKGPKNPVEQVSRNECQAFLGKLNAKAGAQTGKFVLPTEAQWEYACRAGGTTKYCFGDDEARLGDYAWYGANSLGRTHAVGEKKPNTFGLYDMHGNVWEWCADWYVLGYYAKSPADDPRGPTTGSLCMARGGGWFYPAGGCRSASRYLVFPGRGRPYLGLRICQVPAE